VCTSYSESAHLCVYVCVCVCKGEREREREREGCECVSVGVCGSLVRTLCVCVCVKQRETKGYECVGLWGCECERMGVQHCDSARKRARERARRGGGEREGGTEG